MKKRSRETRFARATAEAVAETVRTADWDRVDRLTDRDIGLAIKDDADAIEFDPDAPFEVVLPKDIDVAAIRHRLKLSQSKFARRIGVSTRLVSDWEQGRQKPVAAARALLVILDELGDVALNALARRAAGPS